MLVTVHDELLLSVLVPVLSTVVELVRPRTVFVLIRECVDVGVWVGGGVTVIVTDADSRFDRLDANVVDVVCIQVLVSTKLRLLDWMRVEDGSAVAVSVTSLVAA